jgi:GDP/UDP-N,N'-diacetylbacillosamine 2-epimerase (hydrolysing)
VPLLEALRNHDDYELGLLVTGMHLSPTYGYTVNEIIADGYPVIDKVDILLQNSSHGNMSRSVGLGIMGMTAAFERYNPDLVFLLGDRGEMLSAAISASHLNIPVAHLHGGEVSGSIDESVRHAITKFAHLHFPSTELSSERIIKMGERPEFVFPVGALRIDTILNENLPSLAEIKEKYQLSFTDEYYIMVFHPVTTDSIPLDEQVENLLTALLGEDKSILCILPNSDAGSEEIINVYNRFSQEEKIVYIKNFQQLDYLTILRHCYAMVGNSSSGILEAASFQKAVINIGSRQKGRERSKNVVDVEPTKAGIKEALHKIEERDFLEELSSIKNIYGDGKAAKRILSVLESVDLKDVRLIDKMITY